MELVSQGRCWKQCHTQTDLTTAKGKPGLPKQNNCDCETGKFSLRPYQNDYGNYRSRRNDYGD